MAEQQDIGAFDPETMVEASEGSSNDNTVHQSAPAVQRVLFMPELLEAVILQLPIQSWLPSIPLVCSTWRNMLRDSPKLQEALFMKPVSDHRPCYVEVRPGCKIWTQSTQDPDCYTLYKNPFVRHVVQKLEELRLAAIEVKDSAMGADYRARKLVLLRLDASWGRMFLSQPPMGQYDICLDGAAQEILEEDGQLRLGDMIKDYYGFRPRRYYRIQCVEGTTAWKDVQYAQEVGLSMRPKPKWLL